MGERKRKLMTSRELADRINDLTIMNVVIHEQQHKDHNDIPFEVIHHLIEKRELIIRDIADGLLRLDHNGGVAVTEPKPIVLRRM